MLKQSFLSDRLNVLYNQSQDGGPKSIQRELNRDRQTFTTIYSRFLRLRVRAADAGAGAGAGADVAALRRPAGARGAGVGAVVAALRERLGFDYGRCASCGARREAFAATVGCWVARVLGRGLRCGCGLLALAVALLVMALEGTGAVLGGGAVLTLGAALALGAGGGNSERGRNIICSSGPGVPMRVRGIGSGMRSSPSSSSSSSSASESAAAEASAAEASAAAASQASTKEVVVVVVVIGRAGRSGEGNSGKRSSVRAEEEATGGRGGGDAKRGRLGGGHSISSSGDGDRMRLSVGEGTISSRQSSRNGERLRRSRAGVGGTDIARDDGNEALDRDGERGIWDSSCAGITSGSRDFAEAENS
ncbi:hypothetical protein BKA62DRAFT_710469 [Auriculariales sp. MPI-PUGE-AT-0066]|nr:hypothetical protein BKA62DRAFT_710469 [Auriculariales sp. MPI-PUGE-AT-0066]